MDNKATAILFVHGIQESPAQFQWMIDQLPHGYAMKNVLLAGHGGNVEAFRHAGKKEWLDQVNDTAIKLCRQVSACFLCWLLDGVSIGNGSSQAFQRAFFRYVFACLSLEPAAYICIFQK